ncbi:hypothetical protein D9M69_636390 [compost metagenome]
MRGHPVDHAVARRFVAQEDVLRDRQQRHQRELLVDDDHPQVFAVADVVEAAFLPFEDDLAVVAAVGVDPGEHLHQG